MDDTGTPGPEGEEAPVDVVATVGALDPTVLLLREFLHRSGAIRAVAVVELEDDVAIVDVGRLQPVEVTIGERVVQLPARAGARRRGPRGAGGQAAAPLRRRRGDRARSARRSGGLEHYAIAVRQLAQILGGQNVALASWETTTPDLPLSITARASEDALVLALGEEEFEMEPGWPADRRAGS
jgi:hypothetical protein